jgi:hypothetical protein
MATTVEQLGISSLKLDGAPSPSLVFEPFDLPSTNQRTLGAPYPANTVTPLALRPSVHDNAEVDLDTVVETIKSL